ncbi:MAG: DUF932 domain-containing protein [Prosthecobacter sp.]|uniref:DUF932 domain-containing protein n=1 Tax=Prosthecobacter sp. TaxID=1965333 RepID=UPI0019F57838|nr:DUF932 domain-containing protein [Prosthecobacter sp.]MBE2287186.1 DUF932 domain-containing protein [Prosthecobacter sp.]
MKHTPSVQDLLFDVDQVPIEAVIGSNGSTRRISIPGKKALVNQLTGLVLGVVSRDYRVVTNKEAVKLAQEVCEKAFPGLSSVEWEAKRAAAPRTLSYAFIDLMHRTHVLNYMGTEIGKDDPFTPFLRVTNSFNGARALRFDIGFMRKHCSNGVIFEEEVATIKASHSKEALAQLKIEITSRSLPQMWDEFSKFLTSVRSITMDTAQSTQALNTVLRLPEAKPEDKKARAEGLQALSLDFSTRLTGYQKELGPNAYAVFNTLTDIAARPPDNAYFQKDRDTIEKRSGRWLKELAHQSQTTGFNLNAWLPAWEEGSSGRQIPGRN